MTNFEAFSKTTQGELLRLLKLDKEFTKASKDFLYYKPDLPTDPKSKDQEVKVHDFLGGYGSTILGHNNQKIQKQIENFLKESKPIHAQLSSRKESGELAKLLNTKLKSRFNKDYISLFTNSGTESVELALKQVQMKLDLRIATLISENDLILEKLRTGRAICKTSNIEELTLLHKKNNELSNTKTTLCSLSKAYHGKSLGSLSLVENEAFTGPFKKLLHNRVSLPIGSPEIWDSLISPHFKVFHQLVEKSGQVTLLETKISMISAVFIEPVQGEGGISPLENKHAKILNELKERYGLLIVSDEIQCGLGRTGTFTYSEQINLSPDIILLGKSLGGAFAKIGAVSVDKLVHNHELSILHSSTFADDDLSSMIAKHVIETVDQKSFYEKIQNKSNSILNMLNDLKKDFPEIIKDVRGKGLLLGLEFFNQNRNPSNFIKMFAQTPYFGYFLASSALNKFNVRIGPSLNAPAVLRLEPSVEIGDESIKALSEALRYICTSLKKANFLALSEHVFPMLDKTHLEDTETDYSGYLKKQRKQKFTNPKRAAFVCHISDIKDLKIFDPSVRSLPVESLNHMGENGQKFIPPGLYDILELEDANGDKIELGIYALYENPKAFVTALYSNNTKPILDKIQGAVDMAKADGCQVVGLGGLTSIIAKNGTDLFTRGMSITTGNSLTVATSVEILIEACKKKEITPSKASVAVVGATGNIGEVSSALLAQKFKSVLLIGRPGREDQLNKIKDFLKPLGAEIKTSIYINDAKSCDTVFCVSNSSGYIVHPENVSEKNKVIVDTAVPNDVHPTVAKYLPDTLVVQGGLVRLGNNKDFMVPGIPTPPGTTFACLAETLTLTFKDCKEPFSYGLIKPEKIEQISKWYKEVGFSLGPLVSISPKTLKPTINV
jgi:acetylornithine/succinyldiaminopimelate/putrescine aminotransferase/predicted amino acid dehydrogenase